MPARRRPRRPPLFAAAAAAAAASAPPPPEWCSFAASYPKQYVAYRTGTPPRIDGRLDDPAWDEVPWTDDFVDIEGSPPRPRPRYRTRAKMRWDAEWFYVAAEMEEPRAWANLTERNSVIFHDNDFEVFVDPGGTTHYYKEYEVNAFNTVWNLCLNKPYIDGGYENSSRVFGAEGWDLDERSGVWVDGALNDPDRPTRRWTTEAALPVAGLLLNQTDSAPRHGGYWRVDFSRVQWRVEPCRAPGGCLPARYEKEPPDQHEDNWVWSPTGEVNMHLPERWGYVQFSTDPASQDPGAGVVRDPEWPLRRVAMLTYDANRAYREQHGAYTDSLAELRALSPVPLAFDGWCTHRPVVELSAGGQAYTARVADHAGREEASVRDDRLLTVRALPRS